MEVENSGLDLRTRRNAQPAAKQITPILPKKYASAGRVFGKHSKGAKQYHAAPRKPNIPKLTIQEASDEKAQSLKSRSSSRSPQKNEGRASRKRSDMHPLAIEFRDTSYNYRRHLFESTTLKINTDLQHLLTRLYESTLQTVSSDAGDGQDEPLRLTVPAKFERAAQKVYQPISAYQVHLHHTNAEGERMPLRSTLEKRMLDFEERISAQRAEIESLKRNWETIVGEIWKVGVQCLGEESMEAMLFTSKIDHDLASSPSRVTMAASTLFVPEHDTSPPLRKTGSKKRVTFEAPDMGAELPTASTTPLHFLHGPTRLRREPVPDVPVLSAQDIEALESQITELGKKEIEEYRKAERDYHAHWQKKTAQVLRVFKD